MMGPAVLAPNSLILDGRFRVLRSLGSGGMGEVYLGEQVSLGRKVAIKVLHQDLHLRPGMSERFKREARLLSAVDHPSVVRVIDYGESDHSACIVMELVDGQSLHDTLVGGALPPPRALPLLHQLAEGLAAIHDKGIIHRDLKPENVLLSRGPRGEQARLLDFGIARMMESDAASHLSQVGMVLGTPEYLSPEQAVGGAVDARSDLYCFGVLAYRVLSGWLPFDGPEPRQFLAQHAHAPPRPLLHVAPALSAWPALVSLVMRLMEKDPAERLPNAHALADALAEEVRALAPSVPAPATEAAPSAPGPASPQAVEPSAALTQQASVLELATPPPASAPPVPTPAARGTVAFGTPSAALLAQPEPARAAPAPGDTAAFTLRPSGGLPAVTSGTLALKSQNLVLLLTGIQDFTARTSRQTREENARMLEAHERLVLPLLRDFGGRLLQRRGDALLAAFGSPTESLLCGMAVQDALWRHNEVTPPVEQLHLRLCLHAGEVLVGRDSVLGEPVEVLKALEAQASAGDVTFTEAVNLARNRAEAEAEAEAEACGALPLPGRDEQMQLYRCTRQPQGAPFGLRAAPPKRTWVPPAALASSTVGLWRWLRARPGPAATVGVALALVLGGGAALRAHRDSPVVQARALLEEGRPKEALERLQQVPEEQARADAALQRVRALALHAVGRHEAEEAVLAALEDSGRADAEPEVLDALAEDFGTQEGDKGLRRVLDLLPKDKVRKRYEALAREEPSPRQWGALRYLDSEQQADGLALVELYSRALSSKACPVRAKAARRLGVLGSAEAVPALQRLAGQPKEKEGLFGSRNCGQDEAAEALRALQKKK